MNKLEELRKELKGKTGMDEALEEDLFQRILTIEENDGVVSPLTKMDWALVGILIAVFGIAPVLWYAIELF